MCLECHAAHSSAAGGVKVTCAGAGCHASTTDAMRRLAGHAGGEGQGRTGRGAAEGGVILGLAVVGFLVGRRLSPREKRDGGSG